MDEDEIKRLLSNPSELRKFLPSEAQYLRALVASFARQHREMGDTLTRIEESIDRLKDPNNG